MHDVSLTLSTVEGLYTYNFSVLCWRSFEDIAAPIPDDDQIGLHNRFAQQSQDALGVHGKIGTAEKAVMVALAALERMALLAGQTPKILPLGVERLRELPPSAMLSSFLTLESRNLRQQIR